MSNKTRVAVLSKGAVYGLHVVTRVAVLAKGVVYSTQEPVGGETGGGGTVSSPLPSLPARGGAVYMDSYLEYDGRHVGTDDGLFPLTTLTVSGGTTWGAGEAMTVTASTAVFTSGDVGNVLILHATDGTTIRLSITVYTSAMVVTATPSVAIPVALRSAAVSVWDKAVDMLGGLDHLEGKDVAILGDNHVVGSPHNARIEIHTVSGGEVELGDFYTHVYVGLPYFSDLETLDIDKPSGSSLKASKMAVTSVGLLVEKSRALWVGGQPPSDDTVDPLADLTEMPAPDESDYESLHNGFIEANSKLVHWNDNGRVFIRSVDPTPATVLAAIPAGFIPSNQ